MNNNIKIETLHLFPILDKMLIDLLISLTDEEWNAQTVAKLWTVKDVAAHLLDGNLRGLSISRDRYFGDKAENINSYQDLVGYLNQLNLDWTRSAKRLSPKVLTNLLESTGREYTDHLKTLNPFDTAIFSVAWAGQEVSQNWFHIAREYTEKFLHQQQIRDATGKQGIMTRDLFYPFIDTLMFAFPYTFRNVVADTGTIVSVKVTSEIGGQWHIIKTKDQWTFIDEENLNLNAQLILDPHTAWKLFSKSWKPVDVLDKIKIVGDRDLGREALNIVAFMA
jgi:uncharacterized protein (TIGR03083 family)